MIESKRRNKKRGVRGRLKGRVKGRVKGSGKRRGQGTPIRVKFSVLGVGAIQLTRSRRRISDCSKRINSEIREASTTQVSVGRSEGVANVIEVNLEGKSQDRIGVRLGLRLGLGFGCQREGKN